MHVPKQELEDAPLGSLWRETTPDGLSMLFMRTRHGGMHGLVAIATDDPDIEDALGQFIGFEAEDWEIITPSGVDITYEQVGVVSQVTELLTGGT